MTPFAAVEEMSGGPWDPDGTNSWRQLYRAVRDGEVRCRLNRKPINDPTEITESIWTENRWGAVGIFIEVRVEDVRRIWNRDDYDIAELVAHKLVGPDAASIMIETAIANLLVLHRRLETRLKVMPLAEALVETEFESRWAHQARRCNFLLTVEGQNPARLQELKRQLGMVEYFAFQLITRHKEPLQQHRSRTGRRPTYDWEAAKQHVFALLDEHGAPSADDPAWSAKADVERALATFFQRKFGREPASSAIRQHVSTFLGEWLSRRQK